MTSINKCDAHLEYLDDDDGIRVIVDCEKQVAHVGMHTGKTTNLGARAVRTISWLGNGATKMSETIYNLYFGQNGAEEGIDVESILAAIEKRLREGTASSSEVASLFSSRRDDGMWSKTTEEYKFPKIDKNHNPVKVVPDRSLLECKRCGGPWDERHQRAHDQDWHIFWVLIAVALVALSVLNVILQVQSQ